MNAKQPGSDGVDDFNLLLPILRNMLNERGQMLERKHTVGDENFLMTKTIEKIRLLRRQPDWNALREEVAEALTLNFKSYTDSSFAERAFGFRTGTAVNMTRLLDDILTVVRKAL